uniref:RasGEF domain protein n=1 Tax=Pithovirus LCPAC304 TaxID=2506594 RepID=A0A481Z7F9_9VIRU|nr:MAG: RasGEF domain protein [Pithovirus LCPAC304]
METPSFTKTKKWLISHIKSVLMDKERLQDFLLVHELYLTTSHTFHILFHLLKRYECSLSHPFTYTLEASGRCFQFKTIKKLSERIRKRNGEDARFFREAWLVKEPKRRNLFVLGTRKMTLVDRSIHQRASTSAIYTTRMLPDKLRASTSAIYTTRMLPDKFRVSMKSVVESLHQPDVIDMDGDILSRKNIKKYFISSALTHIDQQFFKKLSVSDLRYLNRGDGPALNCVRRMADQHVGILHWFTTKLEESTHPKWTILNVLRVCKHLKKQRNWHSLLPILKALQTIEASMWNGVPTAKQTFFQQLLSIYDPTQAFSNYRLYLRASEARIVCFPFFSRDMYLFFEHNMLWLEEGNINEDFIALVAQHYRYFCSAQNVTLVGRIDEKIVQALTFAEIHDEK